MYCSIPSVYNEAAPYWGDLLLQPLETSTELNSLDLLKNKLYNINI